jgi:hypothetical protein
MITIGDFLFGRRIADGGGETPAGLPTMPLAPTSDSVDTRELPPAEMIFGQSSLMASAKDKLERVADTTVPVLLQGESGTGKEIFARLLHAYSRRASSPWVKVNCPAIPHSLIESELFGYEKGAFTGAYANKHGRVELAHMGTLFLDEVGSLDLSVQAKLLQVLQDGSFMRVGAQESRSVNTRIISAATGNLRNKTNDGTFRLDFFFRINAVTIDLPSLRQRIEDLPKLVDYFFEVHSKAFHCNPRPLSREILRLDATLRLAGKYSATRKHDSQLHPHRQRRSFGGGTRSFNRLQPDCGNRSREPCLAERDHQGRHAGPRTADHLEGFAGQRVEPAQDRKMAQYQLQIAAVQVAGDPARR